MVVSDAGESDAGGGAVSGTVAGSARVAEVRVGGPGTARHPSLPRGAPGLAELLADCVHCGFCLPACPTYLLWGEEPDSPRGRIDLLRAVTKGEVPLAGAVARHLDACLGCLACVPACPSGVRYDQIIERARPLVEIAGRPLPDRLWREAIFRVFPYPRRVRAAAFAAWAYRRSGAQGLLRSRLGDRLPEPLATLDRLVPPTPLSDLVRRLAEHRPADGVERRRVGLLTGCVASVFFSHVHRATLDVLAAEGCAVVVPRGQGCCGALALHAGQDDLARAEARATIDAFTAAGVDTVVVNAAGCGSTVKEYGALLADDPDYAARAAALAAGALDVTELLAALAQSPGRHPERRAIPLRVAYHDACHLAHAQGVRDEPRRVLSAIPGLELVELAEPDVCCGSAGIYNLVQPGPAAELGERKAAAVTAAGVDVVATANPGCLLQLERYLDGAVPVVHPVELVEASLRGVVPSAVRAGRSKRPGLPLPNAAPSPHAPH